MPHAFPWTSLWPLLPLTDNEAPALNHSLKRKTRLWVAKPNFPGVLELAWGKEGSEGTVYIPCCCEQSRQGACWVAQQAGRLPLA